MRRGLDRSPLETPDDADIAISVRQAAESVLGKTPRIAGVPFWTDAALLSAQGIPSLLFGPSGEGAHAAEEWVDLESVRHVRGGLPEDRDRFLRVNERCGCAPSGAGTPIVLEAVPALCFVQAPAPSS